MSCDYPNQSSRLLAAINLLVIYHFSFFLYIKEMLYLQTFIDKFAIWMCSSTITQKGISFEFRMIHLKNWTRVMYSASFRWTTPFRWNRKSFSVLEPHEISTWKTFRRKPDKWWGRISQRQSRGLFQFWFIVVPSRGDGTIHVVFLKGVKQRGRLMNLWENEAFQIERLKTIWSPSRSLDIIYLGNVIKRRYIGGVIERNYVIGFEWWRAVFMDEEVVFVRASKRLCFLPNCYASHNLYTLCENFINNLYLDLSNDMLLFMLNSWKLEITSLYALNVFQAA